MQNAAEEVRRRETGLFDLSTAESSMFLSRGVGVGVGRIQSVAVDFFSCLVRCGI